jgi:hypothetical protein
VVGFPASEVKVEANPRKSLEEKFSIRQIDDLASNYFDTDKEYEAYRNGADCTDFWKWAYNQKFNKSCEVPDGYYEIESEGVNYFVKRIGNCVESDIAEIDLNGVLYELEKVNKEFPGATPKVFLRHEAE